MMKRGKSSINVDDLSESEEKDTLDSVDRISALPDLVLGVILSFLPTKNAVATSILSKRWKSTWLTIHNLDFCIDGPPRPVPSEGEQTKFVEFVNRVLRLHDSGILEKFSLVWRPHCILSHVTSWISFAIARNVHELVVCVSPHLFQSFGDPELFEMPVFSSGSLRSMTLDGDIFFPATHGICLPRLENLRLVSVIFETEESFERLITGCLLLNSLYLYIDNDDMSSYSGHDDFTYIVSSTSLRRLEMEHEMDDSDPSEEMFSCSLKLEASSLEYLKLTGFRIEIFVQKNLSSLVEGELDIQLLENDFAQANVCNLLVKAVRALECAKVITLSGDVTWALGCATINLSTEFKRLVKFKTLSYCCYSSSILEFIQSSDCLESLTVVQEPNWVGKTYLHDHSNWTAPAEVPRCLSNNLKEVELNDYSGFEDEREMIRYLLKHGSALKVLKIGVYRSMDSTKFELLQEICMFPRKSVACEVEFIDDLSNPMNLLLFKSLYCT